MFGVFNDDEFKYRLDTGDDSDNEQPKLFEMTKTVIEILRRV